MALTVHLNLVILNLDRPSTKFLSQFRPAIDSERAVMASTKEAQSPIVRFAEKTDVPLILSIIRELADYENAASSCLATEESLLSTLSFPSNDATRPGYAKTLLIFAPADAQLPQDTPVATNTPQCAGMALFFHNYSTWRAAPGIYLEDLFVRPQYRKRGYGKILLQELARETKRVGGQRLEWSVLKWNQPSIDFYQGMGAKMMNEWVGMRVDFEALDRMAEGKSLNSD